MTENYIPSCVTCPKASCTRSNICARYAEYQKAKVESDTFKVLNPERLKLDGASCPYCLVAEKQLWARGFKRIYDSIPSGRTHRFYLYSPYSPRTFYKVKNGEKLIEPEMQKRLLAIFKEKGADMSIGFDSYEEKVVLVKR